MKVDNGMISEALAQALGEIVGGVRREWMQELELLRTERRLLLAELRLAALGQMDAPAQPAAPARSGKLKTGART